MRNLVLASASFTRARLLREAGLAFLIDPPRIDERSVRNDPDWRDKEPALIADRLAELKALEVAHSHPGSHVIGADQILVHKNRIFSQPGTREKARLHLLKLAGDTHELISSVCLAGEQRILWRHSARATLKMKALNEGDIEDYLTSAGREIYRCVGAYQIEGLGRELFESVEGEMSTIQGLPMLPLCAALSALEQA